MTCIKCNSTHNVKNGNHHGCQRYKYKDCGYQFTTDKPRGADTEKKCLAIILYINGLSFRAIAKIIKVSHKAVYDWVKAFAIETYEKPKPQGDVIVELDEMWHFIKAKKTSSGFGKHIVVLQVSSSTGNADGVTVIP